MAGCGQDPENSAPRRDIPVSPHTPGCHDEGRTLTPQTVRGYSCVPTHPWVPGEFSSLEEHGQEEVMGRR